jgi:hypothetical protein
MARQGLTRALIIISQGQERLRLTHADRAASPASPPPPLSGEFPLLDAPVFVPMGRPLVSPHFAAANWCLYFFSDGLDPETALFLHPWQIDQILVAPSLREINGDASAPNDREFLLRPNALYLCVVVGWCSKIFRSQRRTYPLFSYSSLLQYRMHRNVVQ